MYLIDTNIFYLYEKQYKAKFIIEVTYEGEKNLSSILLEYFKFFFVHFLL